MAYEITSAEYADIDGVPLHTPAWFVPNLWELWQGPSTRGSDRLLPGANGVRPNRRRATVTQRVLEINVFGDLDWEGTPTSDARTGLMDNIAHLRSEVTDPVATPRTLTLHMPDASTRTGSIWVESFEFSGQGPMSVRGGITITLLNGSLTDV